MRHRRPTLFLALGLAALVAACDGATGPTASPEASGSLAASTPDAPGASAQPSSVPTSSATPAPPTASPTPDPASPTPGDGSEAPGPAAACSGTDGNRTFFASVAADVGWTLYCPVLPSGWFVETGEYHLASGGRMDISYRGPSGRRLELHEGAFCSEDDGCVPPGSDAGDATFGGMSGALVALDDGGWAIVVDRGASISWLAVVTGVDEAGARSIAAAFVPVEG
jgi:hypothetical protein